MRFSEKANRGNGQKNAGSKPENAFASAFDPDAPLQRREVTPGKKLVGVLVCLLCLAAAAGAVFGIGNLLLHEGREMDISVDTSGERYTESVTFVIENVLGMDLLLDEQPGSAAKVQRKIGEEWEDVCEIRFLQDNGAAVSAKYGGMFSHLAPGESLTCRLESGLLETLESGTYRLAVYYISEEEYTAYLYKRAEAIEASLLAEDDPDESEEGAGSEAAESGDGGTDSEQESGETGAEGSELSPEESEMSPEEIPEPETRALYRVFTITSKADVIVESGDLTPEESEP